MAGKSPLAAVATAALLAGLLATPALAASTEEQPGTTAPKTVSVSCDAFTSNPAVTETVTVASGTPVALSLCSNPTTGYRWSEPVSSDPAVASASGWVYSAPASDALGASGTEDLTIDSHAAGSAVITTSYDRPWEGGEKGAWTVQLTVEVRDANQLVIGCDEFEATPAVTRSVDLAAGTSLVLSLCSNPSTGFRWSGAASSDPTVASVSRWIYEAPSRESGMMGAPGTEHLTIDAHAAGTAVITASYDQPWDGGQDGTWSLELTINVD
jgi:inhibitor of cysteine peptidase